MIRSAHRGHGPRDPVAEQPRLAPGAVRRFSATDVAGGRDLGGDLTVQAIGRDVRADRDGRVHEVQTGSIDALVRREQGRPVLDRLTTDPPTPQVECLLGAPAQSGFRRRLVEAVPDHAENGSLLYRLLDDLPGALIISGYAFAVDPPPGMLTPEQTPSVDVCSGWRADGAMMTTLAELGRLPSISGPAAPPAADLSAAESDARAQRPGEVRRVRRMDIVGQGALLRVKAMFRDTYRDADGDDSVIHEYWLDAVVDRTRLTIVDIAAEPRVLPWLECPMAAASARRLVGLHISDVRSRVQASFSGITTCTHLNDLLRSLGDVSALAALLGD